MNYHGAVNGLHEGVVNELPEFLEKKKSIREIRVIR